MSQRGPRGLKKCYRGRLTFLLVHHAAASQIGIMLFPVQEPRHMSSLSYTYRRFNTAKPHLMHSGGLRPQCWPVISPINKHSCTCAPPRRPQVELISGHQLTSLPSLLQDTLRQARDKSGVRRAIVFFPAHNAEAYTHKYREGLAFLSPAFLGLLKHFD